MYASLDPDTLQDSMTPAPTIGPLHVARLASLDFRTDSLTMKTSGLLGSERSCPLVVVARFAGRALHPDQQRKVIVETADPRAHDVKEVVETAMVNPAPDFDDILAARGRRPQRHRLLQGFPAVPAMVPVDPTRKDAAEKRRYGPVADRSFRGIDGSFHDHRYSDAREGLAQGPPPPLRPEPDTAERRELIARAAGMHGQNESRWREIVAGGDRREPAFFDVDPRRDLIVGVIPHTYCVPRVYGCGFCTFPHDMPLSSGSQGRIIRSVLNDIDTVTGRDLVGRRVHAIYLGGGTANLSSTEDIAALVQALGRHLDISDAELTLEGTPQLFARWFFSHLKNLARQPTATKRISMGVQTFDDAFLRLMGREKFGDAETVRRLVRKCHELDLATSADLLFNLPGQTTAQMEHDVDTAVAAGLDQICLYNLVLYEGLGTGWSEEPELVAAMRNNEDACSQWLRLRERLLTAGYVQTTLTNFEREDVTRGPHRFRYEEASFSAERTDGVGFGPMSLTTFLDPARRRGLKLMRRKELGGPPWSDGDLMYRYDADGLKRLQVTRGLAKTRLQGHAYQALHGSRVIDDLAAPLAACVSAGLVVVDGDDLVLTPVGMFYADAVVSTLAHGAASVSGAGLHTRDLLEETPRGSGYVGMG